MTIWPVTPDLASLKIADGPFQRPERDWSSQAVRCFNSNCVSSNDTGARQVRRGRVGDTCPPLDALRWLPLPSPRGCDLTCQSEFSGRWAQPVATCRLQPCFTLQLAVSLQKTWWRGKKKGSVSEVGDVEERKRGRMMEVCEIKMKLPQTPVVKFTPGFKIYVN